MKLKIFNKNKTKQKGFTLVESLVSVALILIAVIGPLTLTFNAINSIMQNRNRVAAAYLAEEIIENFRMYRDSLALACGDIFVERNFEGEALSAACVGGNANLNVSLGYLQDDVYVNKNIAWKLFLERISSIQGRNVYLDKSSFSEQLDPINEISTCSELYLVNLNEYKCSLYGTPTNFTRVVNVSVMPENKNDFVRISVNVVYAKSNLPGGKNRSVNVVDYIYER